MKAPREEEFFIGWASPPKSLRGFLLIFTGLMLAIFVGLSIALSATRPDPGPGALMGGWGRQTVTGVMQSMPYPTVTVTKGTKRIPEGRTLMIAGQGKRGVQRRSNPLDGKLVQLSGNVLKRGALDMIQARGGKNGIKAAQGAAPAIADDERLGRWRLTGEVCDGKCYAGIMRPGLGLAHKACANLCLIGGIPPVFVSTKPVEGSEFLMMADAEGAPLDDSLLDLVGRLTQLEGDVIRRGDLLIFHADLDTAEFVQ